MTFKCIIENSEFEIYSEENLSVNELFDIVYEDMDDRDILCTYYEKVLNNIPSMFKPLGKGVPDCDDEIRETIIKKYCSIDVSVFRIEINNCTYKYCSFKLDELLLKYHEERSDCEESFIDTATIALSAMSNFLSLGKWFAGLRYEDGRIITDVSLWPSPTYKDGTLKWTYNGENLTPIIWFGIEGEKPIDCWCLFNSEAIFDSKSCYTSPVGSCVKTQENWKHFWFCDFWKMDWNELWEGNETLILWAFGECGMDEPEEFDNVREACPIVLDECDSTEEMLSKIEKYCLKVQKAHCKTN